MSDDDIIILDDYSSNDNSNDTSHKKAEKKRKRDTQWWDSMNNLPDEMHAMMRKELKVVRKRMETTVKRKHDDLAKMCDSFDAFKAAFDLADDDLSKLKEVQMNTKNLLDEINVGYCKLCKSNNRVSIACFTPKLPCGCRVCEKCISLSPAWLATGRYNEEDDRDMSVTLTLHYKCPYCRAPFTRELYCNRLDQSQL